MAKRTFVDDLIDLPWWLSLVLAPIVYIIVKFVLPSIEFESPIYTGLLNGITPLAGFFSFFLVFTACASAFHSWRKGELLESQTSVKTIKDLS